MGSSENDHPISAGEASDLSLLYKLNKRDGLQKIKYILKNTATGYITILIWLTFIFQFILYPYLFGDIIASVEEGIISNLWASMFTLQPTEPQNAWTYLTSVFSHGGIIHALINTIVLVSFGVAVENDLDKKNFLFFFVACGVTVSIVQMIFGKIALMGMFGLEVNSSPLYFLGSSGAISAVIGLLSIKSPRESVVLIFLPWMRFKIFYIVVLFVSASILLVVFFGVGAFGVSHIGHAAGVLIGMLVGLNIYGSDKVRQLLLSKYRDIKY